MSVITDASVESEAPVNPYSLLDAVNRSSGSVNVAWLIFLGLMAYVLITVACISHKDLLLNNDIVLPILQVRIGLTRFFLFAPIVLVLLHMGVIGQLVVLARKALEFASAIRMLETTEQRSHPLRLELDNFFFVQAIAGPERSRIMSCFLYGVSWLTLVVLPVALLLLIQLMFVPFHDVTITTAHQLAVIADIALLMLIGVFLMRSDTSFFRAFWRTGLHNPGSLFFAAVVLAAAAFFSLAVATVPDDASGKGRMSFLGSGDGALLGLFNRNLNVADIDLVVDKDVSPQEPSISLRGRDLRYAKLDRADLHQADMTGANLDGASLVGADLRNIWLQCADVGVAILSQDRKLAKCASARGANFSKARLTGARMSGVDLTEARFEGAHMEAASLAHSTLAGAMFVNAHLERADVSGGVALQGTNFLLASLAGADLSGAELQLADFSSAGLQGASLSLAGLEGAVLRNADLDGANLQMARLYGADLTGARLVGADLTEARVWQTQPPSSEAMTLADASQIVLAPPGEEDNATLEAAVAALEQRPLRARVAEGMAPFADPASIRAWATSPQQQVWALQTKPNDAPAAGETYKSSLTDYLAKLACRARFADGSVAAGIAKRAMGQGFKGDVPALYQRLRASDCMASASLPVPLMRDLATAADAQRP
jgi:uncharacterized protein YjbI with pentapeptide repeats